MVTGLFAFTMDPLTGKLFWGTTYGATGKANLDGTSQEGFVPAEAGVTAVFGMAVDTAAGRVYWTDRTKQSIESATVTGTLHDTVLTGLTNLRPIGIRSGLGKIYWSQTDTDSLRRANLDGTSPEAIALGRPGDMSGIAVTYIAPNSAPIFVTTTTLPNATERQPYSTEVVATDGDNDALTITVKTGPNWLSAHRAWIDPNTGQRHLEIILKKHKRRGQRPGAIPKDEKAEAWYDKAGNPLPSPT